MNLENANWERYSTLNSAIVEELFGEGVSGRPVYLDLDPDKQVRVVEPISEDTPSDPGELIFEVVRETLQTPDSPLGVFSSHVSRVTKWLREGKSITPPPCIGLLTMLSLVAVNMKQTDRFAGSNYYGRLRQVLHIDADFHDQVIRDFRRDTPVLWNALNRWLEDSNGRYGLPTAVAFDRRRFIGIPLSQALVRAQDRLKLPALFKLCGLQAGQRLSVQVMEEILGEWIPNSNLTQSLKRLWSKSTNKERISEVVCAELEGWDGTVTDNVGTTAHKSMDDLLLAGEFRGHLQPTLDLCLLVRQTAGRDARSAVLSTEHSSKAKVMLQEPKSQLRLEPIPGTSWSSLEPAELVYFSKLLVANIVMKTAEERHAYRRRAKRFVLLKKYEEDHLFVEVHRAELLETYLIFVVTDIAEEVRSVLQQSARKGWREMDRTMVVGLSPDWTVFQNVQLERIVSVPMEDLKPLQPIGRTHLALGDGLALPGIKLWHRYCLPELRVIAEYAESDTISVRAVPTRCLNDQQSESDIPLGMFEAAGVVNLSDVPELVDGDFRIVVESTETSKKRTLATAQIRVRSASYPRPLGEDEVGRIANVLDDENRLIPFCGRLSNGGTQSMVMGANVLNPPESVKMSPSLLNQDIPFRPNTFVERFEEDSSDFRKIVVPPLGESLPICFTRDYHHWLAETRMGQEAVYSICRDCGRERWWDPPRRRRRLKEKKITEEVGFTTDSISQRPDLPEIPDKRRVDMELVLDALSYLRTGSWSHLRSMTRLINDATWYPHEAARRLEALGHIQVEIDSRSITPKAWCIAPAVIVEPEIGPCFLAGSRSAELLNAVREIATNELEGEVRTIKQLDSPDIIEIHGLASDDLELLVNEINLYRNLDLDLSIHPASGIAALFPTLNTIRSRLPELTISGRQIERLNLEFGRWESVEQMDRGGAYRIRNQPIVYAVVPSLDLPSLKTVVADVRLAKYIAARDSSFALIGYDHSSCTLLTSAGAPLPSIFERAAVLCSGRLPTRRPDGTLAYGQVSKPIAEAIFASCGPAA